MFDIVALALTGWDDVMCSCVTPTDSCCTIRPRRPWQLQQQQKNGEETHKSHKHCSYLCISGSIANVFAVQYVCVCVFL